MPTRDEQILSLLPQARRLAARIAPSWLYEDCIQAAMCGACEAVDRFDGARNESLPGYAWARMKGALLDYLREMDPLTRPHRAEVKAGEAKFTQLSFSCYYDADDDEPKPRHLPRDVLTHDPRHEIEQAVEARQLLDRLPQELRVLAIDCFWRNIQKKDIAAREGVSAGAISLRLRQLKAAA